MQQLIRKDIPKIPQLCRQHFIISLYGFGSAVREDFKEENDVEYLSDFGRDGMPWREILRYQEKQFLKLTS